MTRFKHSRNTLIVYAVGFVGDTIRTIREARQRAHELIESVENGDGRWHCVKIYRACETVTNYSHWERSKASCKGAKTKRQKLQQEKRRKA